MTRIVRKTSEGIPYCTCYNCEFVEHEYYCNDCLHLWTDDEIEESLEELEKVVGEITFIKRCPFIYRYFYPNKETIEYITTHICPEFILEEEFGVK